MIAARVAEAWPELGAHALDRRPEARARWRAAGPLVIAGALRAGRRRAGRSRSSFSAIIRRADRTGETPIPITGALVARGDHGPARGAGTVM